MRAKEGACGCVSQDCLVVRVCVVLFLWYLMQSLTFPVLMSPGGIQLRGYWVRFRSYKKEEKKTTLELRCERWLTRRIVHVHSCEMPDLDVSTKDYHVYIFVLSYLVYLHIFFVILTT